MRPIGLVPGGVLRVRPCIALRLSLARTVCQRGVTLLLRHKLLRVVGSKGLLHGRALSMALMLGAGCEPGGVRGRGPGVRGSLRRSAGCSPLRRLHGKTARGFCHMGMCHWGGQPVGIRLHGLRWDCRGYQVGQAGWHVGVPVRWLKGAAIAGTVLSLHTCQKSCECSIVWCTVVSTTINSSSCCKIPSSHRSGYTCIM